MGVGKPGKEPVNEHGEPLLIGYDKRRLSPCRKKLKCADDDEGCQTGVGRSRSREGAGPERAEVGQGRIRTEVGTGQEQGRSRV